MTPAPDRQRDEARSERRSFRLLLAGTAVMVLLYAAAICLAYAWLRAPLP